MVSALPQFHDGWRTLRRYLAACLMLLPYVSYVVFHLGVSDGFAQEGPNAVPAIWTEILKEAERIPTGIPGEGITRSQNAAWEAATRIARQNNRSTINALFKGRRDFDKLPPREPHVMYWSRELAAYVIVKIADPEGNFGPLPSLMRWSTMDGQSYRWDGLAIASMDCFHDDQSRNWLFDVAITGDQKTVILSQMTVPGSSYIALQLLRGYPSTPELRQKLEQELAKDPTSGTRRYPPNISRADTIRSVLSSWDYAASLPDKVQQERFREFEQILWRSYVIVPENLHNETTHFVTPAAQIIRRWQPGNEAFVLRIFANPLSTPDEANIAVWMATKLPDISALHTIAGSTSPQAKYAREALEVIRNTHRP